MINRHRFAVKPWMRKGMITRSPIPTRIVSNEEFLPPAQTPAQATLERLIDTVGESAGRRLGLSRRDFLKTTGGMAAALLTMNAVFGRFFDVLDVEMVDAAAFAERSGEPFFIFDVQTHYVSAGYDPTDAEASRKGAVTKEALVSLRRRAREAGLNPKLSSDRGTLTDLAWENFIKEVF
ncbi:MAG: twin-arginine translocation signal domain-containing protein, partial [Nitrospirota bacterium]